MQSRFLVNILNETDTIIDSKIVIASSERHAFQIYENIYGRIDGRYDSYVAINLESKIRNSSGKRTV